MFNPYVITFTSFPLDRGTLEFNGKWKVRNGKLNSENHVLMNDPHITRTMTKREGKKLPLPLILAFVRERDNLVDYNIPITGDLKDPKIQSLGYSDRCIVEYIHQTRLSAIYCPG